MKFREALMTTHLAKRVPFVAVLMVWTLLGPGATNDTGARIRPSTPATPAATAPHPDPNFYVFLCFGQSNMEGAGHIEAADRDVDERFQVMADFDDPGRGWTKGEWYRAVPPLTRRTKGISLVDSFGKTMVANLPKCIRIGVVKVGISGT